MAGASVTLDHNGYLRNHDELLPSLLNDLVAAAYGDPVKRAEQPGLVRKCRVKESSQRRRLLLRWLVAARITAVALFAALVWADTGRAFQRPMRQLMDLAAAPAGMSSDPAARVLFAALTAAAFYLAALLAWQAVLRRSVRRFFHETAGSTTAARPDRDVAANQVAIGGLSGGVS